MSWGNLTIITWTSQKSKLHPRPRSYQGSYIDAMDQSQPLDPVSKVLRGYLNKTFRLSKKDMFLFTPGRLVALKTPFPCSVSNPFSRVPSLKHVQCIRAQDWFRHDKWVTFTDQSLPDWFTTFSLKIISHAKTCSDTLYCNLANCLLRYCLAFASCLPKLSHLTQDSPIALAICEW